MAEEERVPKVDWGTTQPIAPECGTLRKVEFARYGNKQIIMTITTELDVFQFAMLRSHIASFSKGLADIAGHRIAR